MHRAFFERLEDIVLLEPAEFVWSADDTDPIFGRLLVTDSNTLELDALFTGESLDFGGIPFYRKAGETISTTVLEDPTGGFNGLLSPTNITIPKFQFDHGSGEGNYTISSVLSDTQIQISGTFPATESGLIYYVGESPRPLGFKEGDRVLLTQADGEPVGDNDGLIYSISALSGATIIKTMEDLVFPEGGSYKYKFHLIRRVS